MPGFITQAPVEVQRFPSPGVNITQAPVEAYRFPPTAAFVTQAPVEVIRGRMVNHTDGGSDFFPYQY